jgi:hypothetical protein
MVTFSYSWQFAGPDQFYLVNNESYPIASGVVSADSQSYTVDHGQGTAFLTLPVDGSGSAALGGAAAVMPFGHFGATGVLGGQGEELAYFVAQLPVQLTLTDLPSGQSAVLDGLAEFQGSVGDNVTSFAAIATFPTSTTQLGGRSYTVSPVDFDWVPFPGPNGGPLTLGLEVSVSGPAEEPQRTPEPSALALALGGLTLLGIRRCRRGRG